MDIPLTLVQYRFTFKALETIHLPNYTGSSWRGLFGHVLQKISCVINKKQCQICLFNQHCSYSYIFETPLPPHSDVMKKYPSAPHPYVISPMANQPSTVAKGESLSIDVTLMGKANMHLMTVIKAFEKAGSLGIGKQQGKFSLQTVQHYADDTWKMLYRDQALLSAMPTLVSPCYEVMPKKAVNVTFMTPYRTVSRGKLIKAESFNFQHLLSPLMRRLSMLSYFHTDTALALDFADLTHKAKQVELLDKQLSWYDWQRYSSRQDLGVKMGGVVGHIVLEAQTAQLFWPLLWLGQYTHVGKGCVMGLGKYRLTEVDV